MSRPDLVAALREQTPRAPAALRERVRLVAATAAPSPARRRPRRALALAVVLAALAAAAVAVALLEPGRGSAPGQASGRPPRAGAAAPLPAVSGAVASAGRARVGFGAALAPAAPSPASTTPAVLPAPSPTRAQSYRTTLRLRLPDGAAVEAAARRAVAIADALGGYPRTVEVSAATATGTASLALAVPRARVVVAVDRLSRLGTVTGEHVAVSDRQSGIDALGRRIVRLERELGAAERAPQTPQTRALIAALTAQIEGLQRTRAGSLRSSRDATVTVLLATPPARPAPARPHASHPGPFHALGVAFRDLGIGLVYALALGIPLALLAALAWLAASRLRRRREEALLSRS